MAIRNIVKIGDDILRKVCRTQLNFDERLATVLDDMADTMYKAEGVGLASCLALFDDGLFLPVAAVCEDVVELEEAAGNCQCGPAMLVKSHGHQNIGDKVDLVSAVLFRQGQEVVACLAVICGSLLGVLVLTVALFEVFAVVAALHKLVDALKQKLLLFGHRKFVHV